PPYRGRWARFVCAQPAQGRDPPFVSDFFLSVYLAADSIDYRQGRNGASRRSSASITTGAGHRLNSVSHWQGSQQKPEKPRSEHPDKQRTPAVQRPHHVVGPASNPPALRSYTMSYVG